MKRLLVLILLLATSAAADVIILNDGTRLEGQLTPSGADFVLTAPDGSTRQIVASDIKSIQRMPAPVSPDAELASLRRRLASVAQPGIAVGQLREFISRHPGTVAASDAQVDLSTWQHRADLGLVQFGGDWVTPEQFATLKAQSAPVIEHIQSLLSSDGKSVAAQKEIAAALKTWPTNTTLLYLHGITLYHARQYVPAREALEAAAAGDPANASIHNNLAVTLWQMRRLPGALIEYERAMVGDNISKAILDNVNIALHNLPPTVASGGIARRVAARFEVLDNQLRTAMAKQGLRRYGSEWIGDAEYTQRTKRDLEDQDLLTSYPVKVQALQNLLKQIEQAIGSDMATLHAIDQESTQITATGQIVQFERPARYQEIAKEVADLTVEKVMKTKELQSLPKELAEARANHGPLWTAPQALIGENGLAGPTTRPAATTQPATQP